MVRKFGPQPWNGTDSKFSDLEPRDREAVLDFLKRHDLKGRGGKVGIEFHPARMGSSTLLSHRVVRWASRQDKSEELYAALNHQHFILGKKLNDRDMLAEACESVGLDKLKALEYMATKEDAAEIIADIEKIHDMGIHSIPTFIINDKYKVDGA
jgi:predicted DsbA family dithiol-disulfide isomerase